MTAMVEDLVSVAGNGAVDLLIRGAEFGGGPALDRWDERNLQLLDQPIEAVLGGCGAAPAFLLGKLGARVVLNCNIGSDPMGALLRHWLADAGVQVEGGVPDTAVHVIGLNAAGQRRSHYYPGHKVDWQRSLQGPVPQWFLAAGYGLVDGEDLEVLAGVFSQMRLRGAQVAFDPGPWFAAKVETEALVGLSAQVDCLLGTEEELSPWCNGATGDKLAGALVGLGPRLAVVKRGAAGATYATRSGELGTIGTTEVEGANTVGAGDSFNGRLICGLSRSEPAEKAVAAAVELATAVVAKGVGVLGAPV